MNIDRNACSRPVSYRLGPQRHRLGNDESASPFLSRFASLARFIPESAYTWFAVIGPDTAPLGERSDTPPVTSSQVAATVAAFVGEDFPAAMAKVDPQIRELVAAPTP